MACSSMYHILEIRLYILLVRIEDKICSPLTIAILCPSCVNSEDQTWISCNLGDQRFHLYLNHHWNHFRLKHLTSYPHYYFHPLRRLYYCPLQIEAHRLKDYLSQLSTVARHSSSQQSGHVFRKLS